MLVIRTNEELSIALQCMTAVAAGAMPLAGAVQVPPRAETGPDVIKCYHITFNINNYIKLENRRRPGSPEGRNRSRCY